MFAVIRHPDLPLPGTCPSDALAYHRARGWHRVSDWRIRPDEFDLDEFPAGLPDLDAADNPAPAPAPVKADPTTSRTKSKEAS